MTAADLIKFIALADLALVLLGTGTRLGVFKKLHPALKFLVAYLLMVGLIEILAKLYVYGWLQGSNLYLLHFYTLAEFALLALMYLGIYGFKNQQNNALKLYFLVAFCAILLYTLFSLSNSDKSFELYSKLIVNGTMIALALTFFIQSLRNPNRYLQNFNALAYLNSGILLYFTGSFIIYLILNQMIRADLSETLYLWLINVILTFIFHLACITALWQKDSRQTKTSLYG